MVLLKKCLRLHFAVMLKTIHASNLPKYFTHLFLSQIRQKLNLNPPGQQSFSKEDFQNRFVENKLNLEDLKFSD